MFGELSIPYFEASQQKFVKKEHGTFFFTKFINLWIKFKIKKSYFKNFFCCNFCDNLKTLDEVDFSTPHGSQIATTVAILSPALPHGES